MAQLPRRCPVCNQDTIIGHGRRRKQAHDEQHDWIWVRRGRCPPCNKTFTVLPTWSPPSCPYSYECRQQACDSSCQGRDGQTASYCLDSTRLPDESTLRRWIRHRLISIWAWMVTPFLTMAEKFLKAPTILAWDFPAAGRILRLEANSP